MPGILRSKAMEPILLGRARFAGVDARIRVRGGDGASQVYAVRRSVAEALLTFEAKKEAKDTLARYDRAILVADPRRGEPTVFGARARDRIGSPLGFGKVIELAHLSPLL